MLAREERLAATWAPVAMAIALLLSGCGATAGPAAGPLASTGSPSPSAAQAAPPSGNQPTPGDQPGGEPAPGAGPAAEPSALPPGSPRTPLPQPPAAAGAVLPPGLAGVEWTRLPTARKVVALTFDAGSMAQGVPSILDTLAREHVPGTFFLTGRWVTTYPDLARRIAAVPGDSIGNHTWDHADLRGLPDAAARMEIADGERWILAETGRQPRPLFRFPYGGSDARLVALANGMGYGCFRWTVDTLGWKGTAGGQSVATVYDRAIGAAQPGEIILMHVGAAPDGSTLDASALGRVIVELRRRGYGFVSLGAAL